MNWEAIAAIGEILGALGVLASLIYLATQIRDNTRSLQAASLQSVLDGPRDRVLVPFGTSAENCEVFALGLNSLDNLNPNQQRQLWFMLVEHCFQMQQVMHLRERDLIPQVDHDAWLAWTASVFRTPGGAAIWPQLEAALTPTIASLIGRELERDPEHPSLFDAVPVFKQDR